MSDKKLSLTYEQLAYICEMVEDKNPKSAIEAFAGIMKKEGLRPRQMPEVVEKLMARQKKKLK